MCVTEVTAITELTTEVRGEFIQACLTVLHIAHT